MKPADRHPWRLGYKGMKRRRRPDLDNDALSTAPARDPALSYAALAGWEAVLIAPWSPEQPEPLRMYRRPRERA